METQPVDIKDVESLIQACIKGKFTYVRKYLNEGGDIDVRGRNGYTALIYASMHEHKNIVELLLKRSVSIEAQDDKGLTALMWASGNGHENVMELLLDRNANIEAQDKNGLTALMWASEHGHENTAKLLLDRGANINAQDKNGLTALMHASGEGQKYIVELLLDRGANIKVKDNEGQTAFVQALDSGHSSIAQRLAQIFVPNQEVPYSGIPISSFIPQYWLMGWQDYIEIIRAFIPMYMERAVKDSAFGIDMQRDIEEILGGKKKHHRNSLTVEDKNLLMKLLKTLRSIDYTDRAGRGNDNDVSPIYDMEL